MRFRRLIVLLLFVLFLIFIYLRSSNDNKEIIKLNEIGERINEIEKLIKTNRKSFEFIKNALLEIQLNGDKIKELKNLKLMIKLLEKQSISDENKNVFKWNMNLYKVCPIVNFTKSNIDMSEMYDTLDFTDSNGGVWKQGFDIKYDDKYLKNEKLKVFVVPHSHQDTGWIKSFDQYFDLDSKIILDNMLDFLIKEPNMKFIHAEVAFFEKWWESIPDFKRNQVKKLLKTKQLEIVTGGWVMTDEANTHFFSILNQLIEGHTWLKQNLNYTPKSGWAIDPFGYSQFMPYILKKSGVDNMVIQRVHYIVKKNLALKKQLEFRWKQYWDYKEKYIIPCHMMPFFSYDIPHTCGPDPAICCQFDFARMLSFSCPWGKSPVEITDANVEERSKMLLDQYRKKSVLFDNGNVLLVPLGDDFRYKSFKEWNLQFTNYKKMMDYMNKKNEWNIEIKFGILSDYFDTINTYNIDKLPVLTGDMFSYADREKYYWTGYFTSRPLLKILDRILMTNLRAAEIVLSLSLLYQQKYKHQSFNVFNINILMKMINEARKTLSLIQHHDAITGTSKHYVAVDFENRLINSIKLSQEVFIRASQNILQNNIEKNKLDEIIFDVEEVMISYSDSIPKMFIDIISNNERYVYLFNSLSHPRQVFVTIPILANMSRGVNILGSGNQVIKCQLTPFLHLQQHINQTRHFVSFKLNIGPLAFEKVRLLVSNDIFSENNCLSTNIFLYNMVDSIPLSKNYKIYQRGTLSKYITIENSFNKIFINSSTGFSEIIEDYYSKKQHKFNIMFKRYGVKKSPETSGAYIFLPDNDGRIIESNKLNSFIHIQGNLYEEIIVKFQYLTHVLRLYKIDGLLANAIDIENIIDVTKELNLEVSMVVKSDFTSPSDFFYTDSNCFQFIRRKSSNKIPIQANVYPMTCGVYLETKVNSNIHKLSLFSKQSNGARGGKYITRGTESQCSFIEVFQDRILNQDDNRGLYESLDDNEIISKKYRLYLEGWEQDKNINVQLGELTISGFQLLNDLIYPVSQFYVKSTFTNKIPTNFVGQKSLLTGFGLPCDYQMINLRTALSKNPNLIIHRLKLNCEARYISEGSCKLSRKKSPLLKSMFDDLTIKYVNKLQLTGLKNIKTNILPEDIYIDLMELEMFEVFFDS